MLSTEWVQAIEGFLAHDRAGGKRSTTNNARRQHLEHLARRVTVGPWAVTTDTLMDYLAAQEWANETRRGRRTTFARFYAWGMYRGFVQINPVDPVPKVRIEMGTARPAPDRAYNLREDGRLVSPGGSVFRPGRDYSSEELDQIRQRI